MLIFDEQTRLCHPNQVSVDEQRRVSESELSRLEKKIVTMEADRETVLASLGEELDEVCRGLARNGQDKLQVLAIVVLLFCFLYSKG